MTRIIFTIAITTAIGFFIGKYFYSSYRDRRLYYSALTDFVSTLSNNLSFKQEKLSDVVLSYKQKTNKIFAEQLENFSNYMSNGGSFSITCDAMKKNSAMVENFFKNMGTVDIFTQKEALKSYQNDFAECLKNSVQEEKNKGMMLLKVFTLLGLAAGIMLM